MTEKFRLEKDMHRFKLIAVGRSEVVKYNVVETEMRAIGVKYTDGPALGFKVASDAGSWRIAPLYGALSRLRINGATLKEAEAHVDAAFDAGMPPSPRWSAGANTERLKAFDGRPALNCPHVTIKIDGKRSYYSAPFEVNTIREAREACLVVMAAHVPLGRSPGGVWCAFYQGWADGEMWSKAWRDR